MKRLSKDATWIATAALLATALCVGVVALELARGRPLPDIESSPRDVVVITVDTLRADHLGAYGYDKIETPHIDALIARGTKFTQGTVPFPRTTPALASMLTGLWAHHHGSREVGQPMGRGTTLGEVLGELGYQRLGLSANAKAGREENLDRGFDEFVARSDLSGRNVAERVTDRALELVRHTDPEEPMFLWVHYVDPHWSYLPPRSWEKQPRAPKCRKLHRRLRRRKIRKAHVLANVDGVAEEALEDCTALYDAEIVYLDAHIGELVAGLREARRYEDAIVVFTADHGENLGEQGLFYEHGPNVHDASLRVPLSIAGPGIPAGATDEDIARIEDVMPTLLHLLGIGPDEWHMDGVSMAWRLDERFERPPEPEIPVAVAESGGALHVGLHDYLVSGRAGGRHCVNWRNFSLCGRSAQELTLYDHEADPGLRNPIDDEHPEVRQRMLEASKHWAPEEARQRTARTPRFKLVAYPQLDGTHRHVLYDLERDPAERTDVSDDHPEVVEQLRSHLDRWAADLPDFEAPQRSANQLEQLRALGYVE